MKDKDKTNPQLLKEITKLRRQISKLEKSEAEHKQAEEVLRLQGEIAANMAEGVQLTRTIDAKIVYTNPRFDEMFGYDQGELIGKNVSILNAPSDLSPKETAKEIIKSLRVTGVWRGEVQNIRKDGTPFWCQASVSKLDSDQFGTVWVAVHEDITARKKAEEALQDSEEIFRTISTSAQDGIIMINNEGKISYWNKAAKKLFGYTEQEVFGKNAHFLLGPKKYNEAYKKGFSKFKKTGKGPVIGKALEISAIRKDGMEFPIELSVSAVKVQDKWNSIGIIRDITARKEAEGELKKYRDHLEELVKERTAKLSESEEKYRALYESNLDGIIFVDLEGNIQDANKSILDMLGYSREEILELSYQKLTPPEWAEFDEVALKNLIKKGYIEEYEKEYVRKDGTKVPISLKAWLTKDDKGEPAGMWGIIRDITERKRGIETLRESEIRFRGVFESKMIGTLFWDVNGDITDANDAFLQMVGYTKDDVISRKVRWRDMTPPEYKDRDDKALEEIAATGVMTPLEKEYIRKDGSRFPIILGAASLPGPILSGVAFVLDITKRKKAEEKLKESAVYLDIMGDALMVLDSRAKVIKINEVFSNLWGYTPDEVLGKPAFGMFAKEELPKHQREMGHAAKEGGVRLFETIALTKDKKEINVSVSGTVLKDEKGKLLNFIALFRDITASKQAEEELKKAVEDLKRSNKDLEQFAYVASHDLQEPLRMVASYVQLLERRYKGKLDSDADEFIAYTVDGAFRMQRMIQDLLTYSRVGTKGKEFEMMDSAHALGQAVANLFGVIDESGAIVSNDDLPKVKADETQIAQLFQNLIDNAIKFRGKEPPRVHIGVKKKAGEWLFSVHDNGIGIDSQYAERIFVIFQRLHEKEKYPGTGIGLSICKRIVERHGGRIWMKSKPGKGATFFFTIPRRGGK
jgi:PAS domain S-box-containing protein